MRRLLWIAVLLGRFAGQEYIWHASRPRRPVPIERPLAEEGDNPKTAWWLLH